MLFERHAPDEDCHPGGGAKVIRLGVIGYGYWGPNMVRNFSEVDGCEVVAVSDFRDDRVALAKSRCPGIRTTSDTDELIRDDEIDAVVIASPVSTHFSLSKQALENGKHVLVEKPMTKTASESEELLHLAEEKERILLVDHTFVYTGAVRKIKEIIDSGQLGELYYYDSMRVNLGLLQQDVDVLWDLAVHDIAILKYLLKAEARAVSATGASHVGGGMENVAYLTLFFDDSFIAHLNVNWLAPVKVRKCLVGGDQKMIVYDDLEPSEKIKVYDKGVTFDGSEQARYETRVGYRSGDMWAPQLDRTEALRREARHFIECIERNEEPMTSGREGLSVVKTLEAASMSMRQRGRLVEL